jgi:hypothetical protein
MKGKQIVTALLLLFVVVSVFMLFSRQNHGPSTSTVVKPFAEQPGSDAAAVTKKQPQQQAVAKIEAKKVPTSPASRSVAPGLPAAKTVTKMQLEPKVVVYYFHGNARCYTCKRIESLALEAVSSNFADEIKAGQVVFRSINVEESVNEHFVADYQLATRSVILARFTDGKQDSWKNLDRVWTLVRDPGGFHRYVADETRHLLGGV